MSDPTLSIVHALARRTMVLVSCLGLASCHDVAPAASAPLPAAVQVGPELGTAMSRAHFAWRAQGTTFAAGHTTHLLRATTDGVEFTPVAHDSTGFGQGGPLHFKRSRVARGVARWQQVAWQTDEEGQLCSISGEMTERLRNFEDGVEQTWRFDQAPAGAGPLEVRVPVAGARLLETTTGGLHFEAGELRVRYGQATWVDAVGTRTPVRTRWDTKASTIVLQVPAQVLASSRYPATLDPVISAEVSSDAPVPATPLNTTSNAVAGSNGSTSLIAWTDARLGRSGSTDIWAARVNASGVVLDSTGFLVASLAADRRLTVGGVAFDGINFVVTYRSQTPNGLGDIYASRVTVAGAALDPTGIAISTDAADQTNPAIACGTGTCLLAWTDYRVASDKPTIIGARLAGTTVQDSAGIPVSSSTVWATDPSVAYDGTNYLVVWADGRVGGLVTDVYGSRVSPAGAVIDTNTSITSAVKTQSTPRVIWAGTKYFVIWADRRNDSTDVLADVYGATVGIASGLQVSTDFAVSTAAAAEATPTLSWDGANALVAWQNQTTNHIMAARVSLAGAVVTAGFTASRADHLQQAPFVAFNGTNHLLGWSDTTLGSVAAVRVNPSAAVLDVPEIAVSLGGNTQLTPAIAVGGGGYLVVWADNRNPVTGADIWGARFNQAGTLLDPTGIAISTATGPQTSPAVAWNGANFLVVWVDQRSDPKGDIYGTRIDASGVVQDPGGLGLNVDANGQRQPAVSGAFNGSTFIVAWSDDRNSLTTGWDIYGARVSSAGVVTTFPIGTQLGDATWPALANDATDYLAAWAEDTTVRGVRVKGTGGTTGAMQDYGSGGYVHPQHVALAFGLVHTNFPGYLVGWDDQVAANGALLYFKAANVFGLSDGPNTNYALTTLQPPGRGRLALTSYSSATYLAVWTGQQSIATTDYDIVAGRVITPNSPTSGGFLSFPDGDGFVVAGGVRAESWPAAIFSSPKQLLVAYQGFDARAAVQAPRIFARPVLLDELPTATAQSITTAEDTGKTITLAGTAPAGDTVVSYALATLPSHGALSGTPPNLSYQPAPNYNGPDSFTFTVKDEWIDSLPGTVTINVTPVNDKPIANDQSVTTAQNTSLGITLTATDVDGDTLTYTVINPPAHGTLTGTAPNLTFTPTTNYNGPDSLVFRVNDGTIDSATATISITVSMVNQRPVATPQNASTAEDTQLNLTLTGTDVEPGTLIFTIVSPPSHGNLTGSPPGVTYTPVANYNGPDSFTFKVNDGNLDSLTAATVSLTITAVNDQPTVNSQTPTGAEDTVLNLTLTGADVELSPLTFTVLTLPTHGTLSGAPPTLTYTPAPNYNGPDSFTFKANDGSLDSAPGTIGITVSSVNDAPVALAQSVSTAEDTQLTVTVVGTDVDGNSLTYAVVTQPAHGTLSGAPPTLTYQPAANYNGADSFTFRANDGSLDSPPATVSITITPVNDAPQATSQSVMTAEDTAIALTLVATDVEGSALTYVVYTAPAHGTLTGTAPSLTYTPNSNFNGADSFTFKANDGTTDSAPATVSIVVTSVNDVPVATPQALSTAEDNQLAVVLTGTDVESSALTFTVVTAPAHGTLSGSPPNLTYSPTSNYNGPDSFTFKVNDGTVDSAVATIAISVTPVNDAPNAVPQTISVPENSTVPITLVGTDVDSTTLTYSLVSVPAHGTLTGTPPNVVYSPATNFSGADSFAFKVNDGSSDSGLATIAITVSGVNTAPVGIAQTVSVPEDTPVAITVAATDVEGNLLSYSAVAQPTHGTLTGTAPNFTYTPSANYNGPDSFTFKASDGALDSAATTVSISVTPINDAPVAQAQTVTTLEDTSLDLVLAGTDLEGSALTFEVVTLPSHGTLSGTAPNLVYTPSPNFNGTDSLTYKANDGALDSVAALISFTVTPVNDAPTGADTAITTAEDSAATVNLPGSDVDGDTLTWAIITSPKHGTVSGSGVLKTYTPEANFRGADDFTFTVSDGTLTSAVFTAKVTVTSVDDAPVAQDVVATTTQDTAVNISLTASDLENDSLTFTVAKQPAHGTLTGTQDQLVYTPERGFSGTDVFTFKANDGTLDSNDAQVTVAVAPAGSTPKDTTQLQGWNCGCQTTEGSAAAWFVLALLGWKRTRPQKRRHLSAAASAPVVMLTMVFAAASVMAAPASTAAPAKTAPKPAKKKKGTPTPAATVEPAQTTPVAAEPPPPSPVVAPAPKGKVSVAVLDVQVTVVGEKLDTDSFTETVVNSVDGTGVFRVISSRDVATMLGYERQKQLLGCGDDSCIAEIASALGSDLLLQASVGKVGTQYVVSARLLDARRSQVVGRGSLKAEGAGALLEALWRASQQALDAYGANLLGDDAKNWAARAKQEPPASIVQKAPTPSSFALTALAVAGYQPLAASGHHLTIGAEVDLSWRFGRLDTSVGVVVSPTPGARLSVAWALVDGPHRFSLGLRGSAFFGAAAYGGGPAVFYEWLFNPYVGLNAVVAGEVYASANTVVLSTMGGLGVSGHY